MNVIKEQYYRNFLTITRLLTNDDISFDEYKDLLSQLMDNYRKDKKNGFKKKTI